MYVTELLARSLENSALDVTHRAVSALAAKYGFSAEEAIADLGLTKLSLTKKQMAKKGSKGDKAPKVKAAKAEKLGFILPFCGSINESLCSGLQFSGGLFTQCKHERGSCESGFCKKCGEQAAKNASGEPDCGTVGQRLAAELMAFRDPKGRAPISYAKYMEKKSITEEQVTEAAAVLGWEVPAEHFAVPEKKTKAAKAPKSESDGPKKRGRPKKDAKVVEASSVDDLFATLAAEAASPKSTAVASVSENVTDSSDDESAGSSEKKATKAKKPKMSEAEKLAAKEAKDAAKAAKEAKEAEEKAAAKAAKEAEKLAAKAAKEAKEAEEKAAKAAEKQAAKAAKELKEAEEKAAKAAAKEAKDAAKASKESAKESAKPKVASTVGAVPAAEPAKKKVSVVAFNFEGKNYLRSTEGVVYDAETKEDVGMWNEASKEVDFFAEDGELSEEEEDEEDDE